MSEMKKIEKIFIGLIVIEVIILIILTSIGPVQYPTPCDASDYSLLDPFNFFKYDGSCIQTITFGLHPLFYAFMDLFILTLIAYLIYSIFNKPKHKK